MVRKGKTLIELIEKLQVTPEQFEVIYNTLEQGFSPADKRLILRFITDYRGKELEGFRGVVSFRDYLNLKSAQERDLYIKILKASKSRYKDKLRISPHPKKGIIFSDIDRTLAFLKDEHGIEQKVKIPSKEFVGVFDPQTQKRYLAYDISTSLYKAYLDTKTQELANFLKVDYDIVLVSSRRLLFIKSNREAFNFANAFILENGGRILDANLQEDREWAEKFELEKGYLKDAKNYLESIGWNIDKKDIILAVRVRKHDNPKKSDEEFKELCDYVDKDLQKKLKKVVDPELQQLDILPKSAGIANAIRYYMKEMGYTKSQSIGLGTINDLEFLNLMGRKYIVRSSHDPKVIKLPHRKDMYISEAINFDGINEILTQIIQIQ